MPWTKTDPVTERQKFAKLVLSGSVAMTEACQRFGIRRKTGYKIMVRHAERRAGKGGAFGRFARAEEPSQPGCA